LKGTDMATAFSDNPRAVLGGNNPPIDERILIDFDEALGEHDGLLARLDEMVIKANGAGPCLTKDTAGRYGDFIKMTSAAAKVIESERETLNRPLLTAQRALKARADHYASKATGAGATVRKLLDAFLAEEERKRRAEEARIAEEARLVEAERQRIIAEAERAARAAAEAERQRLQAIADEEARKERARLQAIEDERAAAEARDAETVVVEANVVEVVPEPVFVPEPGPVFMSAPIAKAPLRGDYGTAVSTVETWHVEVVNVRQVPDAYLKHPTVVEALQKVIGPQVRGKNGLRDIKGCRIYSTVGSSVR
jgi:hypothetical protein